MTSIQQFVIFILIANVEADRTKDPAFVAKVDKLMADTGKNPAKIAEEKKKSGAALKAAEAKNSELFSKMEKVCEEAADKLNFETVNGTAQETALDENGKEITRYMGSAEASAKAAQDAAMNVILDQEKTDRVTKATENYSKSLENCEACKKDKKSSKCKGLSKKGKKAKGETVVEEKIREEGGRNYESHAAQNLMLFGAFASLV